MRIDGEWYECDDGAVRPIIRAEVLAMTGFWEPALLLVDTGADGTVFSPLIVEALGFPFGPMRRQLGGIGGVCESAGIETRIRFSDDRGRKIAFRSEYAAVMETGALDISVLGRDILDMFAVIVDRPGRVVALVGQRHRYTIEHA